MEVGQAVRPGQLGHPGQPQQRKGCRQPAQVQLLGPEDEIALQTSDRHSDIVDALEHCPIQAPSSFPTFDGRMHTCIESQLQEVLRLSVLLSPGCHHSIPRMSPLQYCKLFLGFNRFHL